MASGRGMRKLVHGMDAKFEWFGFSVARKHVYFYVVLIASSVFANTMKESLLDRDERSRETVRRAVEWNQRLADAEGAALASLQ